jgi:predicted NUDIX family phosphoesterase
MKHPQYILAFDKTAFGRDVLVHNGFFPMTFEGFIERANKSLFIGRRHELETDESFGQLLPYILLCQQGRAFTYNRTKLVGEERLAGLASIGVGGHVDLDDVMADKSVINILATLAVAISRELGEEILFVDTKGDQWTLQRLRAEGISLIPQFIGVINDQENEVGRVHYGAVFVIEVPTEYEPICAEAELQTVGMIGTFDGRKLEPWSEILRRDFLEKEADRRFGQPHYGHKE